MKTTNSTETSQDSEMKQTSENDIVEVPVRLRGMLGRGEAYVMRNPFTGRIEFVADTIETFERARDSGALARAFRELVKKLETDRDELYASPLGKLIGEADAEPEELRATKEAEAPLPPDDAKTIRRAA